MKVAPTRGLKAHLIFAAKIIWMKMFRRLTSKKVNTRFSSDSFLVHLSKTEDGGLGGVSGVINGVVSLKTL